MNDLLALLAAIALIIGNGLFVGAEFALISVRRDRLDTVAAGAGNAARAARTVLRAMGQLPRMLAASQLAITVFSLLLGRLGEPAVAHLVERPLTAVGVRQERLRLAHARRFPRGENNGGNHDRILFDSMRLRLTIGE